MDCVGLCVWALVVVYSVWDMLQLQFPIFVSKKEEMYWHADYKQITSTDWEREDLTDTCKCCSSLVHSKGSLVHSSQSSLPTNLSLLSSVKFIYWASIHSEVLAQVTIHKTVRSWCQSNLEVNVKWLLSSSFKAFEPHSSSWSCQTTAHWSNGGPAVQLLIFDNNSFGTSRMDLIFPT